MNNPATKEMLRVSQSYHPTDTLTPQEIETLSTAASEEFRTMNGDSGTIEITVRQFMLLLAGYSRYNQKSEGRF